MESRNQGFLLVDGFLILSVYSVIDAFFFLPNLVSPEYIL